ncbi:MAG: murein biosynthesis integral membrane protein MurJ, partial [Oceanobacter sp.]
RTLDWGIRMVLLIALPASLALGLLAEPLMATIFFYGEVTAHDVTNMALALQSYSSGLVAFMLIKVLGPGYYARQDTMGPVKIGMQAMVVNMVFNLILVFPFQHVGLALATSISSWYNALMLYRGLSQQGVAKAQSGWLGFLAKMLVANAVLVGAIFWLAGDSSAWIQWQGSERVWHMAVVVVVGVMGYLLALLAAGLRVKHLKGEAF